MMIRRTSIRSTYQGQQDENALITYDIPLSLNDITHSSTEEYNRHLARLSHLSAEQMHIIKDIRRRGKNKVIIEFFNFSFVSFNFI
jgi:translation initiation factor 1 (eIF-1/SUI1)